MGVGYGHVVRMALATDMLELAIAQLVPIEQAMKLSLVQSQQALGFVTSVISLPVSIPTTCS